MALTKVRGRRGTSGYRSVRYRNSAGRFFDALVTGPGSSSLETQTLTATGATGGTVRLSFLGTEATTSLAHTATATNVRDALAGLSNLDTTDITVAGGPLDSTPITVQIKGARYGGVSWPLITKTGTLTTADLAITRSTTGGSGHVDLWLTSMIGSDKVLTNVPPATHMSSVSAYYLNWGPALVQG